MSGPWGIVRGEELSAYHENPAVSSTRLMDLRPSPAFFHMRHVAKTLPAPKKTEFDLGNAAHWLILEGRAALEARTVLQPATYPAIEKGIVTQKPWTYAANYCKDWRAAQNSKVILTADNFATIDRMAAAVGENPDAMALLSGGESEVTFRVQHPAFAVQCRPDYWHAGFTGNIGERYFDNFPIAVHLKTCDSIERFRRDYALLRYYYMQAVYDDVISQIIKNPLATFFVALEKNPPFRCEVFEPAESDLELGRNEMLADLKTLRECIEKNVWPNSRLGIQPIELTRWQREMSEKNGAGLFEEAGV